MKKSGLILLFVLICSIMQASAATIGISPGVVSFPRMLKEGYAERSVTVSTNSEELLTGHLEIEGDVADWISLAPDSLNFNFSSNNPYRFTIIMQPPADTRNGNYTGIVRAVTDNLASIDSGMGSAVIAAVALRIEAEVVGDQIVQCRAGAFAVSSTEIGLPFTVYSTVYNDGNIRLRPTVEVKVSDPYTEEVLIDEEFLGDTILPTLSRRVSQEIDNDLDIGQYFVDIDVKECEMGQRLSFDVFEKGSIIDNGRFIGIRTNEITYVDEPTPVLPVFKNEGSRTVLAKFSGQVVNLRNNRIVQVLESDELAVEAGNQIEFPLFFTPESAGQYRITGRIVYNNKMTFDEQSKVIEAQGRDGPSRLPMIFFFLIYIFIGLVILILIGKIKKEKRTKRRF